MRAYHKRASCLQSRKSTSIGKHPVRESRTRCLPSEHARSGDYARSHAIAALARSSPKSSSNFRTAAQPRPLLKSLPARHYGEIGAPVRAALSPFGPKWRRLLRLRRLRPRRSRSRCRRLDRNGTLTGGAAPTPAERPSTPAERQVPIIHPGQRAYRRGDSDSENRHGRRLLGIAPEAATWCRARSKRTHCKKQRKDVATVSTKRRQFEPQLTSRP